MPARTRIRIRIRIRMPARTPPDRRPGPTPRPPSPFSPPLGAMDATDLRRLGRALRDEERAGGNRVPPPSGELLARALAEPERLVTHDPAYARGASVWARSCARQVSSSKAAGPPRRPCGHCGTAPVARQARTGGPARRCGRPQRGP
ncbi:hypothetical protein NKH18_33885 [Streptomyces sp. M10(2022)]